MPAHILQVAYYPSLRDIRAQMLRAAGYEVTSVLGNDKAMALSRHVSRYRFGFGGFFHFAFNSRGDRSVI
jgi:hypothetical protein